MPRLSKQKEQQANLIFAKEYANTLNITQSYLKAYPKAKRTTAQVNGLRMFRRPDIQALIKKFFEERQKKFDITEKAIIEKLKTIVDVDPAAYFDNTYTVKSLDQIPEQLRKLIKNIKVSQAGITIELPDKIEALTKIGQHIGMFGTGKQDDNRYLVRIYVVPAINNQITLPDKVAVARQLITDKVNSNNNSNGQL